MSNEFILNIEYLENIKNLLRTCKSSDNTTHKQLTMVIMNIIKNKFRLLTIHAVESNTPAIFWKYSITKPTR